MLYSAHYLFILSWPKYKTSLFCREKHVFEHTDSIFAMFFQQTSNAQNYNYT